MHVLPIRPPQVKTEPEGRPKTCSHCGSLSLHRHGSSTKLVKDHQVTPVVTVRYQCARCHRTFRQYPRGVIRADQGQWLIVLAAIAWALGVSTWSIRWLFDRFGAGIGRSTALRDVRTVSGPLKARLQKRRSESSGWMAP